MRHLNLVLRVSRAFKGVLPVSLLAVGVVPACEFEAKTIAPDLSGITPPDGGLPPGEDGVAKEPPGPRIGEACDDGECREGLSCKSGTCEATGDAPPGADCYVSAECDDGQCVNHSPQTGIGRCVAAGEGEQGEACQLSADCAAGLRCGVAGFALQCVPEGSLDFGGACVSHNECLSGLFCAAGRCAAVTTGALAGLPLPFNVDCDDPSDEPAKAYFEVPGAAGADELDYFRLPFPNDVRTDADGRVRLGDFPTPGPNPLVGIDPVKLYVDAVEGMQGWGTDSTVIFRFSGQYDFDSFRGADNNLEHVSWVDITDPANPVSSGLNARGTSSRTNYVCPNVMTIRRQHGAPMLPGHTYAVWLGAAGRARSEAGSGARLRRSSNFTAMLENSTPGDAALAAAHTKFAPFRAYLEENSIDADDVLVATVFTVGPVRDTMSSLTTAVRRAPLPTTSQWVRCGSGQSSPCPQAEGERACGSGASQYDEYHALVDLPIFQRGEAPYLQSGGSIRTSPVRTESVCMALTVPKGTMPAAGWPLVVYGHGTGGSFRNHVTDSVAGTLSEVAGLPAPPAPSDPEAEASDAGPVRFAVLGFDAVQHGPRRGDSDEHPNHLFFNFLNPDAAQGNPLQGAADLIAIARMASALDLSASQTGGSAIKINPNALVYFGHSQGAMHGSLAVPYADEYKAAVLSGNGASLMQALLNKTEPENIAQAVPFVVNDYDVSSMQLRGGEHHPVLSLVQHYIDPSDPLNFAQQIARTPEEGFLPKHVFQTYGVGDKYSPPLTMAIYARAANLQRVSPHSSANLSSEDPLSSMIRNEVPVPLDASFQLDGVTYVAGVRQYGPQSGRDGHFVVFDVNAANADVARFLAMAARGQTPQIGQ